MSPMSATRKIRPADEEQDRRQRRLRRMLEKAFAERGGQRHRGRRREAGNLRLAAAGRDHGRARRTGVDGEGADHARQHAAGAQAKEIPVDVRLLAGRPGIGARGGRALHHDHQRDDGGEAHEPEELLDVGMGRGKARPRHGKIADHGQDRRIGFEQQRRQRGGAHGEQGARQRAGAYLSTTTISARQAKPTAKAGSFVAPISRRESGPRAGPNLPEPAGRPRNDGICDRTMWTAMPARNPVSTGMDNRSATQPARKNPAPNIMTTHENGQQRGESGVFGVARGDDQDQRGGENRRDGRIRAHRHQAVGAQSRKPQRARDESVEADGRRQAGETRRGHLFRQGDRGQRQAGEHVAAPRTPGAAQAEEEHPAFFVPVHVRRLRPQSVRCRSQREECARSNFGAANAL